jgi:hypothetical protein
MLFIALVVLDIGCSTPDRIHGTVYEDRNGNAIKDQGEIGISGITVTNGREVTVTSENGKYDLPKNGRFVYVTVPSQYSATTIWYIDTREDELDFGLAPDPSQPSTEFTFVHMTDIHLNTEAENLAVFQQVIDEINEIAPAFVVATGDLVLGADRAQISEAKQWYDAYSSIASGCNAPLYNVLGNHDVVGVYCEEVSTTEQGYNEEMYRDYFGPTYYSFECGRYHCLVLDPNDLVNERQVYRISEDQLNWLQQDLHYSQGKPLLVFFHEPTPAWENRTEVLDLLKKHDEVAMFSGHWHYNVLIDSQSVPEQVSGALCGEWWFGPCPDGTPAGYRIVTVNDTGIHTLYIGNGQDREINILSPGPLVHGGTVLTAQIFTKHGSVSDVFYRVDNNESLSMTIKEGILWDIAYAMWDTTQLEHGYHTITIEAKDEVGKFSVNKVFKITEEDTVPIADLVSNFDAFQGQPTLISGQVDFVAMGKPYTSEGSGAIVLSDGTGGMAVIVGECITPPPPEITIGDMITVMAIPIIYSWDFLSVSQELGLIQQYADLLPEGLLVSDESGPRELMLMRLPSGENIQKIEE